MDWLQVREACTRLLKRVRQRHPRFITTDDVQELQQWLAALDQQHIAVFLHFCDVVNPALLLAAILKGERVAAHDFEVLAAAFIKMCRTNSPALQASYDQSRDLLMSLDSGPIRFAGEPKRSLIAACDMVVSQTRSGYFNSRTHEISQLTRLVLNVPEEVVGFGIVAGICLSLAEEAKAIGHQSLEDALQRKASITFSKMRSISQVEHDLGVSREDIIFSVYANSCGVIGEFASMADAQRKSVSILQRLKNSDPNANNRTKDAYYRALLELGIAYGCNEDWFNAAITLEAAMDIYSSRQTSVQTGQNFLKVATSLVQSYSHLHELDELEVRYPGLVGEIIATADDVVSEILEIGVVDEKLEAVRTVSYVCSLMMMTGNTSKPITWLERMLPSAEKHVEYDHTLPAKLEALLGTLHVLHGNPREGRALIQKAYDVYKAQFGPSNAETVKMGALLEMNDSNLQRNLAYMQYSGSFNRRVHVNVNAPNESVTEHGEGVSTKKVAEHGEPAGTSRVPPSTESLLAAGVRTDALTYDAVQSATGDNGQTAAVEPQPPGATGGDLSASGPDRHSSEPMSGSVVAELDPPLEHDRIMRLQTQILNTVVSGNLEGAGAIVAAYVSTVLHPTSSILAAVCTTLTSRAPFVDATALVPVVQSLLESAASADVPDGYWNADIPVAAVVADGLLVLGILGTQRDALASNTVRTALVGLARPFRTFSGAVGLACEFAQRCWSEVPPSPDVDIVLPPQLCSPPEPTIDDFHQHPSDALARLLQRRLPWIQLLNVPLVDAFPARLEDGTWTIALMTDHADTRDSSQLLFDRLESVLLHETLRIPVVHVRLPSSTSDTFVETSAFDGNANVAVTEAIHMHAPALLRQFYNVCAVTGSPYRLRDDDKVVPEDCVVVYVRAKGVYPFDDDRLPASLVLSDGRTAVPIDVRQGAVRTHGGVGIDVANRNFLANGLPMGASFHALNGVKITAITAGEALSVTKCFIDSTIGAFAKNANGHLGLLTAGHSVECWNTNAETLSHPAILDSDNNPFNVFIEGHTRTPIASTSVHDGGVIAVAPLEKPERLGMNLSANYTVDAAFSPLLPGILVQPSRFAVTDDNLKQRIGVVPNFRPGAKDAAGGYGAKPKAPVFKVGISTGLTVGTLDQYNVYSTYQDDEPAYLTMRIANVVKERRRFYKDLLSVFVKSKSAEDEGFSKKGDSGAIVYRLETLPDGTCYAVAVGMVSAGRLVSRESKRSYIIPMDRILSTLNVSLYTSSAASENSGTPLFKASAPPAESTVAEERPSK